jgi:ribokinase
VRLAVIGHVEWVTFARAPFVPAAGEIVHLEEPFSQPAGGGAVTAVALARMGADVTFYTALGNDGRSQPVLEEYGVRVQAAFRDRPQTGRSPSPPSTPPRHSRGAERCRRSRDSRPAAC